MGKELEIGQSNAAMLLRYFRVWDGKEMWHDLQGFDVNNYNMYCASIYHDHWITGEASRFTGEYCKGVKIYEGDILMTYCYNKEQVGVVKYTHQGWTCLGYHLNSGFFIGGGDSFRILGNIFANPELCKS